VRPVVVKRSPFDFEKTLSQESMDNWIFDNSVQNSKFLDFGANVLDGRTKKPVLVTTPPLKVLGANLHGVGVVQGDSEDGSKGKREYSVRLLCYVDPEIAEADPVMAQRVDKYKALMPKVKERVARMCWDVGVKQVKKTLFLENAASIYLRFQAEPRHEKFDSYDKKKQQQIYKEQNVFNRPEVIDEAFKSYLNDMSSWEYLGNEAEGREPDGENVIIRAKMTVFYPDKKKEKKGGKDESQDNDKSSASKSSAARTGQKKQTKPAPAKESKTEIDDNEEQSNEPQAGEEDESAIEMDADISQEDLEMARAAIESSGTSQRFGDMSEEDCLRFVAGMMKKGFHICRPTFYDHTGAKVQLGKYQNKLSFRVVDVGDYIQITWGIWVSSLKDAKGRYGPKLKLKPNVTIVRQAEQSSQTAISDGYAAGKAFKVREPQQVEPEQEQYENEGMEEANNDNDEIEEPTQTQKQQPAPKQPVQKKTQTHPVKPQGGYLSGNKHAAPGGQSSQQPQKKAKSAV